MYLVKENIAFVPDSPTSSQTEPKRLILIDTAASLGVGHKGIVIQCICTNRPNGIC